MILTKIADDVTVFLSIFYDSTCFQQSVTMTLNALSIRKDSLLLFELSTRLVLMNCLRIANIAGFALDAIILGTLCVFV